MPNILSHKYYMQQALKEAKKAYKRDEVPVGAIVVDPNGNIIAKAYNQGEHGLTAISHAEIIAMTKACKKLSQPRLWDCKLYVTLEPCTMCATAISMMRIKEVIYGASNPKGGAIEHGVKFYEQPTCNHSPNITRGILETECSNILKDFFALKRASN